MTGTKITIKKSDNFTVMSNYHLRDLRLSNKTVGLLSKLLALPDDWDYNMEGLVTICKDGKDSVRSSLDELEKYRYLKRERVHDKDGHFVYLYTIYEKPYDVAPDATLPLYPKKNGVKRERLTADSFEYANPQTSGVEGSSAGPTCQQSVTLPDLPDPYADEPHQASPYPVLPDAVSPDTAEPYAGSPYMEKPYTVNPYMVKPYMVNPSMASPNAVQPKTVNPQLLNKDKPSKEEQSIDLQKSEEQNTDYKNSTDEKHAGLSDLSIKTRQSKAFSSGSLTYEEALIALRECVSYDQMKKLSDRMDARAMTGDISLELYEKYHDDMELADQVLSVISRFISQKNKSAYIVLAGTRYSMPEVLDSFAMLDWLVLRSIMQTYENNSSRVLENPEGYILSIAVEKCYTAMKNREVLERLNRREGEAVYG